MATGWPASVDVPHDPVAGESMASGTSGDLAQEITNVNDRTVAMQNSIGVTNNPGNMGFRKLIGRQVLASAVASVTFSSIPQTFENLAVEALCDCASSSLAIGIQFNGDVAGNYDWGYIQYINGFFNGVSVAQTSGLVGVAPVNTGSRSGLVNIFIPAYARTTLRKMYSSSYVSMINGADAAANLQLGNAYGQWRSTAAITSVTIMFQGTSTFSIGSVFSLYGEG